MLVWILGVVVFLLVITVSVALHEAGHMFTAKALHIPVSKYFVGFGPTLWSTKRGETEYGIKGIPLGGFILVEDTTQPEKSPDRGLLSYVAPWKRIAIFIAGPLVNLVLGIAIIFTTLLMSPIQTASTTIDEVNSCSSMPNNCAANKAGFKAGDKIVELDGRKINDFNDMASTFKQTGSQVVVLRNGKRVPITVKANTNDLIGVQMAAFNKDRSASQAASSVKDLFVMNIQALSKVPAQVPKLITAITSDKKRDPNGVSSVVGIGRAYGETANSTHLSGNDKVRALAMYSGVMNIGLGFANLLPMLPLDGGRILFAVIDAIKIRVDKIRGKKYVPTNYRWVQVVTAITGSALFAFMLLAIVADIVNPIKAV